MHLSQFYKLHSLKSCKGFTTAHLWRDGHFTNISVCEAWGVEGKGWSSSFHEEGSHTYTLKLG